MRTFVSDDYQIAVLDDGIIECHISKWCDIDICITYNPNKKEPTWVVDKGAVRGTTLSHDIFGLNLTTHELRVLYEALKVIGKQSLMDNEITFVTYISDEH